MKIAKKRIAVVGGGASGCVAAIAALRNGSEITIFEQQPRILKKLLATGGGRCNITNANISPEFYHGDRNFCSHTLKTFGLHEVRYFFESIGIPLAREGDLFYPHSKTAASVVDMLRFALDALSCNIKTETPVRLIQLRNNEFYINNELFDKVIVCIGSKASYSGNHDFQLLCETGHSINLQKPALTQLISEKDAIKGLAGLRADAELTALVGSKSSIRKGELLFTDYGISGIAVMSLSYLFSGNQRGTILADFSPDYSISELAFMLTNAIRSVNYLTCENLLSGFVPKRIGMNIIKQCEIPLDKAVADLSDHEIKNICKTIKNYEIRITGNNGFKTAQTALGGVSTDEINDKTMQSRLVQGLYFTGEAIDIAGDCGGFNLQWAWSSGHTAGYFASLEDGN